MLHQRLNLIARLRLCDPSQSREDTNGALNELFDDGEWIGLVERFNLRKRTMQAIADAPRWRAELLGDYLDEMGVPQ